MSAQTVDVLAIMRAASRHVPNEQYAEFDAAIDAVQALIGSARAACHDCGCLYERFGLDLTLPHDQWAIVSAGTNGLLCASCICRRAAELPHTIAVRASIEGLFVETATPARAAAPEPAAAASSPVADLRQIADDIQLCALLAMEDPRIEKLGVSQQLGDIHERLLALIYAQPTTEKSSAVGNGRWVPLSERSPVRNKPTVYWHLSDFDSTGFPAIADEWRDEHHAAYATHWLDIDPPIAQAGKEDDHA